MNKNTIDPIKKEKMRKFMLIGVVVGAAAGLIIGFLVNEIFQLTITCALWGMLIGLGLSEPPVPMRFPAGTFRKIIIAAVVFMILQFAFFWVNDLEIDLSIKLAVAAASALPAGYFVYTIGSAILQLDEMQRRIQLEALAFSFGATMVVTYTYGLMGFAGLEQVNWLLVPLAMTIFWAIGKAIGMRKYK